MPTVPGPDDYVIECRTMVGHGSAPVWVISRRTEVRHIFPDEPLAIRVIQELARIEHCHGWLVDAGAAPVLLTASASA